MITFAQEDLQKALRKAGLRREDDGARRDRAIMRRGALSVELVGSPSVTEVSLMAPPSRDLGVLAATLCGLLCGSDARGLLPRMAQDLKAYSERGARLGKPLSKGYTYGSSRLELSRVGPLMVVTLRSR